MNISTIFIFPNSIPDPTNAYWIGLAFEAGQWVWRDGTALGQNWRNWQTDEPKNSNHDKNCVMACQMSHQSWMAEDCMKPHYFLCEYNQVEAKLASGTGN